jgi:predicted TIM-barrel enzyme
VFLLLLLLLLLFLSFWLMTTVDMIVIYNSGRFRMAGRGSLAGLLPYKDANAIVMEMAGEVPSITLLIPRSFSSTVTPVVCVCVCAVRACVRAVV